MRIGHFLHHYPSPGGTTSAVTVLAEVLSDLGHKGVILHDKGPNEDAVTRLASIEIREVPTTAKTIIASRPIARAVADAVCDLDALFLHGMFSPGCALVGRIAARLGIATVAVPYDAYDEQRFEVSRNKKAVYWQFIERPHLLRMSHIALSSPAHQRYLRDRGVDSPMTALPLAPLRWYQRSDVPPRAAGALTLGFVGRPDVHQKGLDLLMRAIGQSAYSVSLLMVGRYSATAMESLHQLAAASGMSRGRLRLLGYMPDIEPLYSEIDALVLPSRSEGFGYAALEALGAGVPTVLSRRAGLADWLPEESGALLVNPGVKDICGAIATLVETGDAWRYRAEHQRDHIRAAFSRDRIGGTWQSLVSVLQQPDANSARR